MPDCFVCKLFLLLFVFLFWNPRLLCLGCFDSCLFQTDDVGFFCSPVSNEYRLAAESFGLGRAEVLGICRNAVNAIFGGKLEKQRLRDLLEDFTG